MTEFATRWDVYRNASGEPVTVPCSYGHYDGELTDEQLAAVHHALAVWREVVADSGSTQTEHTLTEGGRTDWRSPNVAKSRLLSRMIHHGERPHDLPPPLSFAGGWWEVIEDGRALISSALVGKVSDGQVRVYAHPWPVLENRADELVLRLPGRAVVEPWLLRPATEAEIGERPSLRPSWWLERR